MSTHSSMTRAKEVLRRSRKVVIFSGAGISAESGIATYRDSLTGLWTRYRAEDLETAKAFRQNPALIWGWYLWRRIKVAEAQPNAAHYAITYLANPLREVGIVTQNIDDLHERAGSPTVLHLHGSLAAPKCFACHRSADLSLEECHIPSEGALVEPPRCGRCNGKMRPAVVWYGEDLNAATWKAAGTLVKNCDVLISVGTSGIVTPAASLPGLALANGATVIHVNLQDVSQGIDQEIMLIGRATQVLSTLIGLVNQQAE